MGSNTTQRKAQAVILRAKVADYREWRLIADCGSCGPRALLVGSLNPSATFMQILQRLRCRACGCRAAAVSLANDMPGWQNRVVRIWGPGSFG